MKRLACLMLVAIFAPGLRADVQLHPVFTDHMVLQREQPIPVWGQAAPQEQVTVQLGTTTVTATADDKGAWKVSLPAAKAATEQTLTVGGKNTITLKNVAIGDVWLCSGQSNMEWKLSQLTANDQGKKVAAAATNPNLRLLAVPNRPFSTPQSTWTKSNTEGFWQECKPETVINFSAVGYFFGKSIESSQKVPVGLIAADWGGTPAEAWTSLEGLKAEPALAHYVKTIESIRSNPQLVEAKYQADLEKHREAVKKATAENKPAPRPPAKPVNGGVNQNTPTALYNGLIAPLTGVPVKGAIWYQGESNAGRAFEYRTLFPAMIRDWRTKFGPDMPFFTVQLAPFQGSRSGVDYAELRDAQWNTGKILKNVGTAIITDVGHETDIHPQQKEPVGERLALLARKMVYGEAVTAVGPTYKSHSISGDTVTVQYENAKELKMKGELLAGFQVCGEDKVFKPAKATIVGTTITITSGDVAKPVAVRYGWVNFAKPTLNLTNEAGLPAAPFRTDDFPLTTMPKPMK
ncbi:MAG: sialate O-acetylesterase [Gemmataceae bacterium]